MRLNVDFTLVLNVTVSWNGPASHLYVDACVLSCCQKWRSTSNSTDTQRPWYPCAFSCVLWGCSWQQKLWSTVCTWKASHECGCGCGGRGHWVSWTPWSSMGSHASGCRSPPWWSLERKAEWRSCGVSISWWLCAVTKGCFHKIYLPLQIIYCRY